MNQPLTEVNAKSSIRNEVENMFRNARRITSSYLVGTLLYGGVATLIVHESAEMGPDFSVLDPKVESQVMIALLLVSVLLAFVALIVLPKRKTIERIAARRSALSPIELMKEYASAHALRLVLVELIALSGLVFTFVTKNLLYVYLFGGITALLLLLLFPRRRNWDEVRTFLETWRME